MAAFTAGRHIGFGNMVVSAGPDYAESLVVSALEYRRRASKGARNALNRELTDRVRLNGFRDASKAPAARLKDPVIAALFEDDDPLARALIAVWAESKPELRGAVKEYLAESGGADADGPPWSVEELDEAAHALMDEREDLGERDVGLMLCFESGRRLHVDAPPDDIESPLLQSFLEDLESLPPNAPDWEELVGFVDAVMQLDISRLETARDIAVEAVDSMVEKVLEGYEEELVYLDLRSSVSEWAEQIVLKTPLIGEALPIVGGMLEKLEEYRSIRPQAGTRAEEAERAPRRLAAEDAILEVAARWRELMERPFDEDDPEDEWDDLTEDGPAGPGDDGLREEAEELRVEVERLRRDGEKRQAEYENLAREKADLAAERDSLQAEIARLNDELSDSRDSVNIWRLAGVSARMDEAGLPANEQSEPRTVRDAVARAEKLFPDRLAVALNSKSDKRSPFQKPQEVFDALAWLAVEYHDRRANPGGSPDFDKLLKEACPGWSYKSSQTEITREQFEQWYTTTWDGKTYDLRPHLGKGTSHDPQNTIRIAFAWDDERRRVVVGYIGMHQRNRKS